MNDIPGLTVSEHHRLCLGVLACCYQHVGGDLKKAIYEACESAKLMGMDINPDNLKFFTPLVENKN